jgi:hypothetical protein
LPTSTGARRLSLRELSKKQVLRQKRTAPRLQSISTDTCSGGGTIQTDDGTNTAGVGTVKLTYSHCVEDGASVDGAMIMRVDAFNQTLGIPSDLTVTFQGYTVTEGTFTAEIGGGFRIEASATETTTTFNSTTRYKPEGIQVRTADLILHEVLPSSSFPQETATLEGKFYHSAHGFIEVKTPVALFLDPWEGTPSAGMLHLTGAGAASVDVQYRGSSSVALTLDLDSDGIPEKALQAGTADLLASANFNPFVDAGPDADAKQGDVVTLDGSRSSDWEGDALTYEWTVWGPNNYGASIGKAASLNYALPSAGTYTFTLTVRDSTGRVGADTMAITVAPNTPPVAKAGNDIAVVAGTSVTLDGRASSDVDGNALTYEWTRYAGPPVTDLPAGGSDATLTFTPTTPGVYTYRLRVSDAYGHTDDFVQVSVESFAIALLDVAFSIDASSPASFLTRTIPLTVSQLYSGAPVPISVTSDVPWLKVVSAPSTSASGQPVVVTLDAAKLSAMENGHYDCTLTVTPTGFPPTSSSTSLILQLPKVEHIAPYVAYTGETPTVTLYGQNLDQTSNNSLFINGVEVTGFQEVFATHTRITMPSLPAGEYSIRIQNAAGINQSFGRYVVRAAPTYSDGSFDIAGRVENIEYDPERDAFYVVSWNLDYGSSGEAYRLRYDGTAWHKDAISAPGALAVTLDADGKKLLISRKNCIVSEFDPSTLAFVKETQKANCYVEEFGMLAGLGDGRVLVANTDQWPTVWTYPDFATMPFPSIHSPTGQLNYNRDRVLWAGEPTITGPRELYVFKTNEDTATQFVVHDPDTYFLPWLVSIDGDGRRVMHRQDVYEDETYIGSLPGTWDPYMSPALYRKGDRAVVLDPQTDVLSLYDLTSPPTFTKVTDLATLDDVAGANRIRLLPNDRTAFVFTVLLGPSSTYLFRMYVRNLP